jgi:hypothetical protein
MSGRRPSPVAALIVGAVATALIVGAVLIRNGDPGTSSDETSTAAARGVEPTVERNDASDRSDTPGDGEAAPVDAAIAHVTASQDWLYLDDIKLDAAVRSVSTTASADRLAAEAVEEVALARERLAGSSARVWWLVRPLAWQVHDERSDSARVSVWVVTILSAVDVAAPQVEFATVTVDLELVDGVWLVDAVLEQRGPTPASGPMDQPWDAVPFDTALDGFTRIGEDVDR